MWPGSVAAWCYVGQRRQIVRHDVNDPPVPAEHQGLVVLACDVCRTTCGANHGGAGSFQAVMRQFGWAFAHASLPALTSADTVAQPVHVPMPRSRRIMAAPGAVEKLCHPPQGRGSGDYTRCPCCSIRCFEPSLTPRNATWRRRCSTSRSRTRSSASRPKRITVTPAERARLVKFGKKVGGAIRDLTTIVTPRTNARWVSGGASKPAATKRKPGRPRTPEDIREIILRIAEDTGWGYTGILANSRSWASTRSVAHGVQNSDRSGP